MTRAVALVALAAALAGCTMDEGTALRVAACQQRGGAMLWRGSYTEPDLPDMTCVRVLPLYLHIDTTRTPAVREDTTTPGGNTR